MARLKGNFVNPSLQIASVIITEKGYSFKDSKGDYLPAVLEDFEKGAERPSSYMGVNPSSISRLG